MRNLRPVLALVQDMLLTTAPALASTLLAAATLLFLRHRFNVTIFPEIATDALTDFLPLSFVSWSINQFGGSAKALMFGGMMTTLIWLGAVLPLMLNPWLRERPGWYTAIVLTVMAAGLMLAVSLILVIFTAAHLDGRDGWNYILGTLTVAMVYGLAFNLFSLRPRLASGPFPGTRYSRRHILHLSIDVVAIVLGGFYVGRDVVGRLGSGVQQFRWGKPTLEVTPTPEFYVVSKNLYDPRPDLSSWRLRVDGLVHRQLTLTLADIEALPQESEYVTLECISNDVGGHLINNALWGSTALRDVLESAGVGSAGRFLRFESEDGYVESLPLTYALDPKVRLAYSMNGEALNFEHGAPLRMLTPGKYGMKGPKWLHRITVIEDDIEGYWEARGWNREAWVKTMSRIDVPAYGDLVKPDLIQVRGIAFAGDLGISRVEISEDGGKSWAEARLIPPLSRFSWTHWTYIWNAPAGRKVNFVVRATDTNGSLQTPDRVDPEPDGASGWHSTWIMVANTA